MRDSRYQAWSKVDLPELWELAVEIAINAIPLSQIFRTGRLLLRRSRVSVPCVPCILSCYFDLSGLRRRLEVISNGVVGNAGWRGCD